jgi:hypothetical protein
MTERCKTPSDVIVACLSGLESNKELNNIQRATHLIMQLYDSGFVIFAKDAYQVRTGGLTGGYTLSLSDDCVDRIADKVAKLIKGTQYRTGVF